MMEKEKKIDNNKNKNIDSKGNPVKIDSPAKLKKIDLDNNGTSEELNITGVKFVKNMVVFIIGRRQIEMLVQMVGVYLVLMSMSQ